MSQIDIKPSLKQYRIVNSAGDIYSRSLGWVQPSGKVYGHLFNQDELQPILQELQELGNEEIHIESDKVGSLFMAAASSPFGNYEKMIKLSAFTILIFLVFYVTLAFINQ